jgi:hypothetical protein
MPENRTAVRDLADRLIVEYAGAVPPGQILALVFRAAHRLAGVGALDEAVRLTVCEEAVRRSLTDRIAVSASASPRAA